MEQPVILRDELEHPGHSFPEGADCSPCQLQGCPSRFHVDLDQLPPDLGSGTPRSGRELDDRVRAAPGTGGSH